MSTTTTTELILESLPVAILTKARRQHASRLEAMQEHVKEYEASLRDCHEGIADSTRTIAEIDAAIEKLTP